MSGRRDNGPGISFFSFQDIITSVTGIMFLVVLLLMLLVISGKSSAAAEGGDEVEELRRKAAELREMLAARELRNEEMKKRLEELRNISEADVLARRDELLAQLPRLEAKLREVENALGASGRSLEQLRQRIETLTLELERKQQLKEKNQSQLTSSSDQIAQLEAEARDRRRVVRYTMERTSTRTPVLVECGAEGIIARQLDENDLHEFKLTGGEDFSVASGRFLEWARRLPKNGVYFLLLAKPAVFAEVELLSYKLSNLGFERGREVLPHDDSTIFEAEAVAGGEK